MGNNRRILGVWFSYSSADFRFGFPIFTVQISRRKQDCQSKRYLLYLHWQERKIQQIQVGACALKAILGCLSAGGCGVLVNYAQRKTECQRDPESMCVSREENKSSRISSLEG